MAGIFERMGQSLVDRKKKQAREEADRVKRGMRQRGMQNRRSMMGKLESMGAADKAKEDAKKAKAAADRAKARAQASKAKDKASGIGAVKSPVGTTPDLLPGKIRKVGRGTKKADTKMGGTGTIKSPVGTKADKGFTPGKIRSVGKASTKKTEAKKSQATTTPTQTKTKKPQEKTTPAKVKVTGGGTTMKDRNVGTGANKRANVTVEQLKAAGLSTGPKGLRTYLNMYDKLGKRPKPSDFKKKETPKKKIQGSSEMAKKQSMYERKTKRGMKAGGMKSKMGTKGGAMGGKKKMPPGMMGGGMKSKMSTKGGAMGGKKKMPPGMMAGGLKKVPEGNKGLPKLPKKVRNQMGFMQEGGMKKSKGYAAGGKKSKGYAAGGKKSKMATKKKVSKPKVRGAGIARKGVRPVKYR